MRAETKTPELWRRRLYVPFYGIGEAARYAGTSPQTAARWHNAGNTAVFPRRASRADLSYLQLVELAVVAAMRSEGVKLKDIRSARDYMAQKFGSEFPFAEYRFKTEGHRVLMELREHDRSIGRDFDKSIIADAGGQLAWDAMLADKFAEFDYEGEGLAIRWHVAGRESPVVIDPRVAFGAPLVSGVPTWVLKGRWTAGESVTEITEDFGVSEEETQAALRFEGVDLAA